MILFQLLNVFHLDFISFISANNELSSILGRSGRRIILNMHSNEPRVLVPAFRVSQLSKHFQHDGHHQNNHSESPWPYYDKRVDFLKNIFSSFFSMKVGFVEVRTMNKFHSIASASGIWPMLHCTDKVYSNFEKHTRESPGSLRIV